MKLLQGDPPLYPKARVLLTTEAKEFVSIVDPRDDPMWPEWSWAHLTRPEVVGVSSPGKNIITIEPIETRELPFRLVGMIICGACEEGDDWMSARNIRVRVPG
jgi:hypothetical protein